MWQRNTLTEHDLRLHLPPDDSCRHPHLAEPCERLPCRDPEDIHQGGEELNDGADGCTESGRDEWKRRLLGVPDPTTVNLIWLVVTLLAIGSLAGASALAVRKARQALTAPCPFCSRAVGIRAARCRHCKRPLIIQASL